MVPCDRCGQPIEIENPACEIHPEKDDNLIKAQLIARYFRKGLVVLVLKRREQERRA